VDSQPRRPVSFQLYLVTDRRLAPPHNLVETCEAILRALDGEEPPFPAALQLREKDLGGRELYALAAALRPACARSRTPLIVNGRIDIALAVNADGIHLPADSIGIAEARQLLGPEPLVGISTHDPAEAAAASVAGADFAVFGPVWPPLSKPAYGAARCTEGLGAACRAAAGMPVYALGGVTAERVEELFAAGGAAAASGGCRPAGVATIGAVFGADNPGVAAVGLAGGTWGAEGLPAE
jgi:thiamine-phosphate pyrophosphorylase